MKKSEIRKDYIQDKYVIIAPRRAARPNAKAPGKKTKSAADQCHFCPEHLDKEQYLLEIGSRGQWLMKVVPNKFSAVSIDNPKAYGVQEVVVETNKHGVSLEDLSVEQIAKLLEVYATRTKAIAEDKKIEYILIFKNAGSMAGATAQHAHSQIFATNFLPPHLFDKSQKAQSYKLKTGRCVYCDTIKKESQSPRLIYKDEHVISFAPWASMYNYEAWILPRRHLDNIILLNDKERLVWAKILKKILQKITTLGLPYNFYFHQVVHDEDQHFYMKITPRGNIWAGVEIGSGLVINPVMPEDAAKYYRK